MLEILQKFTGDNISDSLKAQLFETPLVPVLAISDEKHLLLVDFVDTKKAESNIKRLLDATSRKSIMVATSAPLDTFRHELELYFRGDLMEFQTLIKLERGDTDFRLAVWQQIHDIPFGKTKSYAELAQAVDKPNGYRAVANACGMNPLTLIVPCHRVTGSHGELGGYSSGIEKKKWLLAHEQKHYEY